MTHGRLLAGAALIATLPVSLSAQEGGLRNESPEIVVTATHRPVQVTRLPMSVTVMDEDQLDASALANAEDLVSRLAGVEAAVANGTQVAFQIRGIGAVDHQALTPGAAAVYSDGVYLATNVQTGALLYDLQRVEVLKGPQGSLYGRNASSGAINLLSREADAQNANYVRLGYGNSDRVNLQAGVGGAVADGVWLRAAARRLTRDPVLENVAGPASAAGETDEKGLRLSALLERGGSRLAVRGHYETDRGINPAPRNDTLLLAQHQVATEGDGAQDTDNSFYGFSARLETELDTVEVFSLTAFEGYRQDYGFDFDGTPAPFGNPNFNANLSYLRDFSQFSQEVRMVKNLGRGSFLMGANFAIEDFSQRYTIWCGILDPLTLVGDCNYVGAPGRVGPEPASDAPVSTLVTDIEQERDALAAFGHAEILVSQGLAVSLGARVTHEVIEGSGQGAHIFTDGVRALNNRDGLGPAIGGNRLTSTRLTGNLSLSYELGIGMAYASLANGYKSGGFNGEVANNASHYSNEGLFAAEDVTAVEIGVKGGSAARWSYALSGFYQFYRNPQARIFVQFPLPDGSTIVSNSLSNLDHARSYGADAQVSWKPVGGLEVDIGAVWNETQISQQTDIGGNAALFDGNPLPFAPQFAGTFGARYSAQLSDDVDLRLGANAKARTRYFLDAEGLEERSQQGFVSIDLEGALALAESGIELGAWISNVTDVDYATSGYGFIGYNTFRSDPRAGGVFVAVSF